MKIEINSILLDYSKEGKGKPVILLHGNGEDRHIFDKLIQKLKKNFTVYAIDSRNHGKSSKTNDYRYVSMAEDIYQFIHLLKLKNPLFIGFSDGAIIGLILSIKYTQIFEKMVLLGVNLKPSDFKKNIYTYITDIYEKTKDPLFRMMLEQPAIELDSLQDILTPTLVIAAQNDLFYRKMFLNIVKTMLNAQLKIMQGHDHSSYIVNQDILHSDLIKFM